MRRGWRTRGAFCQRPFSPHLASKSLTAVQKGKGRRGAPRRSGLATDREISGGRGRERDLVKWEDDSSSSSGRGDGGGLDSVERGNWDQFKTNEEKFGYKSTFDMDLYTTPLDKSSSFYKANAKKAGDIAASIEGKVATSVHEAEERGQDHLHDAGDEEDRYSGVHRSETSIPTPETTISPPMQERKKLSIAAQPFKPGFNISFGPPQQKAVVPTPTFVPSTPSGPAEGASGPALSFSEKLRLAATKVNTDAPVFTPHARPQWNVAPAYASVPYGPGHAYSNAPNQ